MTPDPFTLALEKILKVFWQNDPYIEPAMQKILAAHQESVRVARIGELEQIPRTRSKQAYIETRILRLRAGLES